MDASGHQIIGEPDDLVGEEAVGSCGHAATTRFGGKAPGDDASSLIEREAEQIGGVRLQALGRQRLQPVGEGSAVDDFPPVCNQRIALRLVHLSSRSASPGYGRPASLHYGDGMYR